MNETNLRHLANYNKGINLARGEYIWLISADDRLRTPYILERYVTVMDKHPKVGYAFCPAVDLTNDRETELLPYSFHGDRDAIFEGRAFLDKLLDGNTVVAASGMVRRECYEKVSLFPLDMPYAGDWYLWCVFALYYDVAYFSEPMVNYRSHNQTMTNVLTNQNYNFFRDGIAVLTRIQEKARLNGFEAIVLKCNDCLDGMLLRYADQLPLNDDNLINSTTNALEELLNDSPINERKKHIARFHAELAECYYDSGETAKARSCYMSALGKDWRLMKVWLKFLLLGLGKTGLRLRIFLTSVGNRSGRNKGADIRG
jgi:glycosyltransferase involved in cell wall biosynthesis